MQTSVFLFKSDPHNERKTSTFLNVYSQRGGLLKSHENRKSALQNKKNMLSNYKVVNRINKTCPNKACSKFRVEILRTYLEIRIFKMADSTSASAYLQCTLVCAFKKYMFSYKIHKFDLPQNLHQRLSKAVKTC